MEEDDEIQSPAASGGSGSAESPRQNGRITVTVAAPPGQITPPPSQGHNKTLTLALPSQSQPQPLSQQGKSSGGGREDCWSEAATAVLVEAWGERYLELSRGNLKQKHWKEVADVVFASGEDYGKIPKTDVQCKNRIDTVKKKYKLEKSKLLSGGGPSKWPFYDRLDHLIGPSAAKSGPGSSGGGGGSGHGSRVPVGMPVGGRSGHHLGKRERREVKIRPRGVVDWDSDESGELSPFSIGDEVFERKRRKIPAGRDGIVNAGAGKGVKGEKGGGGGWGSSVRELTRALLRFGEAYENAETAKLQQVVEMEKQRMKFAKELELQRIQFFMKTQVEISQLKTGSGGGGGGRRNVNGVGNASNHHGINNNNNNNNNNHNTTNSDCSN